MPDLWVRQKIYRRVIQQNHLLLVAVEPSGTVFLLFGIEVIFRLNESVSTI